MRYDLSAVARLANYLEVHGSRDTVERLQTLLDQHNCCTDCGSQQIFDESHYQQTGLWMCPICEVKVAM